MNRNEEVDQWFREFDHPLKEVMEAVRLAILEANDMITEDVKWKAPNFMYKGNMATFNPRAKKNVSLLFHTGAHLNDPTGLLEGDSPEARVARFTDMADFSSKKESLIIVTNHWVKMKDEN